MSGVDEPLTREAIAALVAAFEACSLPFEQWRHRQHLLVCLWYVAEHGRKQATERMRHGIQRYNMANGVLTTPEGGYHETLTLFWLWAISDFLERADKRHPLEALAADMLEALSDKRLALRYYTRERIMSLEARYHWLEPDLRPLT